MYGTLAHAARYECAQSSFEVVDTRPRPQPSGICARRVVGCRDASVLLYEHAQPQDVRRVHGEPAYENRHQDVRPVLARSHDLVDAATEVRQAAAIASYRQCGFDSKWR
jgi:hypothetical protein